MSAQIMNKNFQIANEIKKEFWNAPPEALFDRKAIAAVLEYKVSWLERNAWAKKNSIPYLSGPRKCLYRKMDVLAWIEKHYKHKNANTEN